MLLFEKISLFRTLVKILLQFHKSLLCRSKLSFRGYANFLPCSFHSLHFFPFQFAHQCRITLVLRLKFLPGFVQFSESDFILLLNLSIFYLIRCERIRKCFGHDFFLRKVVFERPNFFAIRGFNRVELFNDFVNLVFMRTSLIGKFLFIECSHLVNFVWRHSAFLKFIGSIVIVIVIVDSLGRRCIVCNDRFVSKTFGTRLTSWRLQKPTRIALSSKHLSQFWRSNLLCRLLSLGAPYMMLLHLHLSLRIIDKFRAIGQQCPR
mmetsp:Transcript_4117/g.6284  ORF Transcript_4117/g.6284 Transcript_4117/m.6284 type:complete len:263 (+) Transcript_4117:406-1194(+)